MKMVTSLALLLSALSYSGNIFAVDKEIKFCTVKCDDGSSCSISGRNPSCICSGFDQFEWTSMNALCSTNVSCTTGSCYESEEQE